MTGKRRLRPRTGLVPISSDFMSNDYLNFSKDPELLRVAQSSEWGMGSTGSRLLSGDSSVLHEIETELATWLGRESALCFNSGYQLNVGLIPTLFSSEDLVLADKQVHASIIDGCRLSDAMFKRFSHNDMSHLSQLLKRYRHQYKRCLIVSESVFSMDGDRGDLEGLSQLAAEFNAELMIDEAHAIGVFGAKGQGLALEYPVDYLVATFGKAFGSSGAFVACSSEVKEQLINHCRSFIYSTALPFPVWLFNQAALKKVQKISELRVQYSKLVSQVRQLLSNQGCRVEGDSHIIPVFLQSGKHVREVAQSARESGIYLSAICHPTVAKGSERIRLSLTAGHRIEDVRPVLPFLR